MFSFTTKRKQQSCSVESVGDDCCIPQLKGKAVCPICGEKAKGVLAKTLQYLLKKDSQEKLTYLDGFFYCKTPHCSTVYFRDGILLKQEDLNVIVGLKDGASPATMCYCFEWSKEKMKVELEENGETTALTDIKVKMENPGCACEVLNPSGGCCLGDITKAIKELKISLHIKKG